MTNRWQHIPVHTWAWQRDIIILATPCSTSEHCSTDVCQQEVFLIDGGVLWWCRLARTVKRFSSKKQLWFWLSNCVSAFCSALQNLSTDPVLLVWSSPSPAKPVLSDCYTYWIFRYTDPCNCMHKWNICLRLFLKWDRMYNIILYFNLWIKKFHRSKENGSLSSSYLIFLLENLRRSVINNWWEFTSNKNVTGCL